MSIYNVDKSFYRPAYISMNKRVIDIYKTLINLQRNLNYLCQICCSSFKMDHKMMHEKYVYKINSSDIPFLDPYPLFKAIVMFNIVTYKRYLGHGNHNFL